MTNKTIFTNYAQYNQALKAGLRNIKFISTTATPEASGFVSQALTDTIRANQAYYF